jgi:DNA invertase Pin-like site-specific DNA recombinase
VPRLPGNKSGPALQPIICNSRCREVCRGTVRQTVGIMAMVAQEERRMISERTKAALAAAKRRGVQLGGDRGVVMTAKTRKAGQEANRARTAARAADVAPVIADLQAAGATSLQAIAS